MNPHYEFISNHLEEMVLQAKNDAALKHSRTHPYGLLGKTAARLGDALIKCGSWLKKQSRTPVENTTMRIYTQH